jgi:hypothetical protein
MIHLKQEDSSAIENRSAFGGVERAMCAHRMLAA